MIKGRRATFVTGAVLVIIVAVLFGYYYLSDTDTPQVSLADAVQGGTGESDNSGLIQTVEITRDNVQDVIRTLSRAESYYRSISLTNYWSEGTRSSTNTYEIWATPLALRLEVRDGASMIITHDTYYMWYGTGDYTARPVTEAMGVSWNQILDEFQGIPSYETVLELDSEDIIDAGYTLRQVGTQEQYCIYVSWRTDGLGYTDKYYISLSSGLLVEMETWDEDIQLYHMETRDISLSAPSEDVFLLPDGTDTLG